MVHESITLELPLTLITRVDALRLLRELKALDDFLDQAAIRTPGTPVKLPRMSRILEDLASINEVNLLQKEPRQALNTQLLAVKKQAPLIHMSFASDPPAAFIRKLVTWLRAEIHPHVLLDVGLQPSIAAGCIIRTRSKYFDCSLRQHFSDKRGLLVERLGAL